MSLSIFTSNKGNGVFHANSWNTVVDETMVAELVSIAKENADGKARLCLHPDAAELMQVTYLAFNAKYNEAIHKHPHRPEVLIPIRGKAERRIHNEAGEIVNSQIMAGGSGMAFSTERNLWHSLILKSETFVMVEIGLGPFGSDSTVRLQY
jgi:cupin fold WbuC family metalloprotein